jgi:hypothetical protein
MEAIGFVMAIVAPGVLALRFGQDSRDGFRSKEHELAADGATWRDLTRDRSTTAAPFAVPAAGDEPPGERPVGTERYPTLVFIERALGPAARALTTAPDARALEVRARELVAEHWSDSVWTTGIVSEAAFRRVLAELAPNVVDANVDVSSLPDIIALVDRARLETAVAEQRRRRGSGERRGRSAITPSITQ